MRKIIDVFGCAGEVNKRFDTRDIGKISKGDMEPLLVPIPVPSSDILLAFPLDLL